MLRAIVLGYELAKRVHAVAAKVKEETGIDPGPFDEGNTMGAAAVAPGCWMRHTPLAPTVAPGEAGKPGVVVTRVTDMETLDPALQQKFIDAIGRVMDRHSITSAMGATSWTFELPPSEQINVSIKGSKAKAAAKLTVPQAACNPSSGVLVQTRMAARASGSSGRNEGLVVMGRYCQMVQDTVFKHLPDVRPDLSEAECHQLARQFAVAYCRAACHNADLVEQTIRTEGFDCDYARQGWVQARDADQQEMLAESVRTALDTGLTDWTSIDPEEVHRRTGMSVTHNAGFSIAAASPLRAPPTKSATTPTCCAYWRLKT